MDGSFLHQLKLNMEANPNGSCESLFVLARDIDAAEYKAGSVTDFQYEVLGGTHQTLATRKCARTFVRLTEEDGL